MLPLPGITLLDPQGRQGPQVVAAHLSQPQNDVQILCLMAAQIDATGAQLPPEQVAGRCVALMAHVVEAIKHGKLHEAEIEARKTYGDPREDEPAKPPRDAVGAVGLVS